MVIWIVGDYPFSAVGASEGLKACCSVHVGWGLEVCDVIQGYFLCLLSIIYHVQNVSEVLHVKVGYSPDVYAEPERAFAVEITSVSVNPLLYLSLVDFL